MSGAEHWEAQAERWATWARRPDFDGYWNDSGPPFFDLLPAPGRRTLEVGCGEGRVTRDLKACGHRVTAVDVAPTMIRLAREADPDGEYMVSDAAALPFDDRTFDLVVAFNSLMDIDDMPGAVGEAARVLVQEGRFCVCITHPMRDAGHFEDATFVILMVISNAGASTCESPGMAWTCTSEAGPIPSRPTCRRSRTPVSSSSPSASHLIRTGRSRTSCCSAPSSSSGGRRASRPPAPRIPLGQPREASQPEPDRRQHDVEQNEREPKPRPPDRPEPQRHRRFRPHVSCGAAASALRLSTVRRICWAVSSIESSEMSITGQPSRRCTAVASSSSS